MTGLNTPERQQTKTEAPAGPAYRVAESLLFVVLVLVLPLLSLSCSVEPGAVSVAIEWSEAPTQEVWLWTSVKELGQDGTKGKVLALVGPERLEVGGSTSMFLKDVPNGEGRVVVVEVREGPSDNLPVVYYGVSEPFSIVAGKQSYNDAVVVLHTPEADGSIALMFQGEERATVNLGELTSATLVTHSKGAVSLLLSNSLSFDMHQEWSIGQESSKLSCRIVTEESVAWDECEVQGWDLTAGLFPHYDEVTDGRYFIYAKFLDENGYQGATASTSVTLDTEGPELLSSSIVKYGDENQEHALLTVTTDEPLGPDPEGTMLIVLPDVESAPHFSGPAQIGQSTSYQWVTTYDLQGEVSDKLQYTFVAKLRDELGNLGESQQLVDGAGEPLVYQKGCDCTDGLCCDGCYFLPDSVVCEPSSELEYGCPWGTFCGDDLAVRSLSRYCSGSSASCDGGLQAWTVSQECSDPTGCSSEELTCVPTYTCDCPDTIGEEKACNGVDDDCDGAVDENSSFGSPRVDVWSGTGFTGDMESFEFKSGCTFIGDDWANSLKVYLNKDQYVVFRDDSCGSGIEFQCCFKGNGCVQAFDNLSKFAWTGKEVVYQQQYPSEDVTCSDKCDDNPHLGSTVNSIYFSVGSCVWDD